LDDVTQSADLFNDDPMDFDGNYTDIQGPQPQNCMHKNELCETRLYNIWQDLVRHRGIKWNNNSKGSVQLFFLPDY